MRTLLACLLVAGCSSSSDHTKGCKDLSLARCTKLMSCSATDLARRYGTIDVCETRETQVCLNSFAAPQNTNTDARSETCATALPSEACNDFLGSATPAECLPGVGPRANGDPCAFAGQCMSTFCAIPSGSNCGTCADLPAEGDDCTSVPCGGRGLVCAGGLCVTPLAVGAACDKGAGVTPCTQGSSCVGGGMGMMQSGTCQADLTTAGGTCDVRRRTAPDCSRDAGLYCTTAGTCAAIVVAADGMPCGYVSGVFTNCQNGSTCFGSVGVMTAGTCQAPAADGAACDDVNGPACLLPARCVGMSVDGGATGVCELAGSTSCS